MVGVKGGESGRKTVVKGREILCVLRTPEYHHP